MTVLLQVAVITVPVMSIRFSRGEHGDFVGLCLDLSLTQHDSITVVERGDQLRRRLVGDTSAPGSVAGYALRLHRQGNRQRCMPS